MANRVYHFRNIAYRRADGTVCAECIDLDISVIRESMAEAEEALNEAIEGYLETVVSKGWADSLVPRPSPFAHRLRYHLLRIVPLVARSFHTFTTTPEQLEHPMPA